MNEIKVYKTDNNLMFTEEIIVQNGCALPENSSVIEPPDAEFVQLQFGKWVVLDAYPVEQKYKKNVDSILQEIMDIRNDKIQNGGYEAENKWFHSDTISRSQQLGLVIMNQNIPEGLMWKTMDGSFIEMTPLLAQSIFQAATNQDSALFNYAESLRQLVKSADDPESIDITSGWPETFQDQIQQVE